MLMMKQGGQEWFMGKQRPWRRLRGYSAGTKKGSLSKQVWWNHEKVEAFKGKYGAAKGHIPVAVYSYQSFDPAQPGYRHVSFLSFWFLVQFILYAQKSGNESSALTCPWQLAVCGKKILMNSHMCDIDAVAPMPNQRIFATASKDCTVRLWDIDDQVGHENGNFSIWRMEINSTEAAEQDENAIEDDPFYNPEDAFGKIQLCCINPLPRMVAKVDLNRKSSEQVLRAVLEMKISLIQLPFHNIRAVPSPPPSLLSDVQLTKKFGCKIAYPTSG
eukprot:483315-Hanusia_phi.AAC.5